jgi:hypothetical protein
LGRGLLGCYVAGWGRFEGDWVNNNRTGHGIFTRPSGNRYEGDYLNDERHGRGIYSWADGRR